jgi:CheY-like chemotaxis protein
LPVVVVTGNARDVDRRELLELGANLVVSKPVEPAVLFEALCRLMADDKRRLR